METRILDHTTLTAFLKEFVRQKKAKNPLWSMAKWAKDLGLKSTTSISLVINGKRNCGQLISAALINYFKFSDSERAHFEFLIGKTKSATSPSISHLIDSEILTATRAKKTIVLSEAQMRDIGHWYHFALRQLARVVPLQRDQEWLRRELRVEDSGVDLVAALDVLFELSLLTAADNRFTASDVIVTTSQNVSSEAIKVFHEEMGTLAVQAIRKFKVEERSFQGCTLRMKASDIADAKHRLEKFMANFESISDVPDGDSIYQLNIQFFPLVGGHA